MRMRSSSGCSSSRSFTIHRCPCRQRRVGRPWNWQSPRSNRRRPDSASACRCPWHSCMHDPLVIGVIEADQPTEPGLVQAARRQPGLTLQTLAVDDSPSGAVAALIVDVPVQRRAEVLQRLIPRWRVPILAESPVGLNLESARAVALVCRDEDAVVSANPLRYALHTRRLLEEVARAGDPLHTFFAAWRFRAQSNAEHA